VVLGQSRILATTHRTIADVLWPIRNSAKPERRGRPAGSRAHFLKLSATGYPAVEHRVTVVTVVTV